MILAFSLMIGLVSPAEAASRPDGSSARFESWFESACRGQLKIPSEVAIQASTFRYVFVGGFRNERMTGYFAQNIAELKALGVTSRRIHRINPSSTRTSEQNAEEIRAKLLAIGEEGPEKIVVIAHSRGACDALNFAIDHPMFIRDRVEALFLVQGPFGGSGAAEYAMGRGVSMDRRMPWGSRILGHLAGRVVRAMTRKSGTEVFEEMTPEVSRGFWVRRLAEHPEALAAVGPRTFYVRSMVDPSRLRFVRRAIAWYLKTYHGASDGMVATADQRVPDLGTVIATLEASHGDLTHRFPATRTPRSLRKALTQSIFMMLGQPRPASASTPSSIPSQRASRARKALSAA